MTLQKPIAGKALPELSFAKLGGGTVNVGGASDKWTLFIVYRGKHCGRCKKYFKILEDMQSAWHDAGFNIVTVSADPEEKAQSDVDEFGWTFDVGYDLTEEQMRAQRAAQLFKITVLKRFYR